MKRLIPFTKKIIKTQTARDTYVLFSGNILSSFFGFLFILVIARSLTVEDFGVFSATINFVVIVISLSDFGLSTGMINFMSKHLVDNQTNKSDEYLKSSILTRTAILCISIIILFFISYYFTESVFGTSELSIITWAILLSLSFFLWNIVPRIYYAQRRFIHSIVADLLFVAPRVVMVLLFIKLSKLTLNAAFLSYVIASILMTIFGVYTIGISFFKSKPTKKTYKQLIKYSGWVGVGRVVTTLVNRMDITMLTLLAGATTTGLYSVPSKLAAFILLLGSSFSSVLAPRFAGFKNRSSAKTYLFKATVAMMPVQLGIIIWIIIARPFIILLFGDKFADTASIFQVLAISMLPYLLAVPAMTAVVYSIRKTEYIGKFSLIQLVLVLILNYLFIPIYGAMGPAYTLVILNSLYAVFMWLVVYRHYYR